MQQQVPFRAEPSQVLFQAHEQGQRYDQSVTLCNTTQLGQRLRLLSPLSPYFSFSGLEYFQSPEQGLVAPGMHVRVTVSFFPDALHDYDDTMVIETGQGRLEVPLRARRDPPCLNLPQQIVVGPTLRANRQVKLLASCLANVCLSEAATRNKTGHCERRQAWGVRVQKAGESTSTGQNPDGTNSVSHGNHHPTSSGTAPAPSPPSPGRTAPLTPAPPSIWSWPASTDTFGSCTLLSSVLCKWFYPCCALAKSHPNLPIFFCLMPVSFKAGCWTKQWLLHANQ